MNVGNSIRYALDSLDRREHEPGIMHACAAVQATAKKWANRKATDREAFIRFLRDNYDVLGPMALPGINVVDTRFPVGVTSWPDDGQLPDVADVIYKAHRSAHAHGDEVCPGFELIDDRTEGVSRVSVSIENGTIGLAWNTIPGLCAVAVLSSINVGQRVPDGYYLSWGAPVIRFEINEWWGRKADFLQVLATQPRPL